MNKHAYLIMAHNNWRILEKLITLLDDERNDIFLHIDARVKSIPNDILKCCKFSKIKLIDRKTVFWADYSQLECELDLLSAAMNFDNYSYFHLLSGVDLPIKSKNEIYSFFERSGKNFIGIVPNEVYYSVRRVKFYHIFTHCNSYRKSKFLKATDRLLEYFQKFLGVNRIRDNNFKIVDGWTWFSIRSDLCADLLKNKNAIKKMFSYSIASDELVLQTFVYNSKYFSTLYDSTDLKNGSMRYIDWQRGKPYTFGNDEKDFDLLINSPYMFARKFSEDNMEIVDKIFNFLTGENRDDK